VTEIRLTPESGHRGKNERPLRAKNGHGKDAASKLSLNRIEALAER